MRELTKLCCQVIAREISVLTSTQIKRIVDCLPSAQCVELIWQELCQTIKDSPEIYLLMQNHFLINGTLNRTVWNEQNVSYRRQSIPRLNLTESIRFFNAVKEDASYEFLAILRLENNINGLESLVHLHSLTVLSVSGVRNPEQLVMSWHVALKVHPKRWCKLRVLNVPQLTSPRLFHDSWQLIPSLLWMGVNLDSSTIRNIPMLNQLVTEAPIKSPMEILCWLPIWQNLGFDSNVILELELNPNLAIPSISSYFPLEAKFSRLPGLHAYMRRLTNKRITIDTRNELQPRPLKRPRHRGIRKGSSLQQLFGWGGP